MTDLTVRQQSILDFIGDYSAANGYAPTVREIARGVGLASVSSVQAQLGALEAAGRIVRRPGSPRALRLVQEVAAP